MQGHDGPQQPAFITTLRSKGQALRYRTCRSHWFVMCGIVFVFGLLLLVALNGVCLSAALRMLTQASGSVGVLSHRGMGCFKVCYPEAMQGCALLVRDPQPPRGSSWQAGCASRGD